MSTLCLLYLFRKDLPYKPRDRAVCVLLVAGAIVLAGLFFEMRTSSLQSRPLAWSAHALRFSVEAGASSTIRFPQPGPFDERLGYSRLPEWLPRLMAEHYIVERQARSSFWLNRLTDAGLFPVYREKPRAGLSILGCDGTAVSKSAFPQRGYPDFASVPPIVVQSLLFIENRELLDQRFPHRNPAIEWDRFGYAMAQRMAHVIAPGSRSPGGSTLATQIEKYRHSLGGRTTSTPEKLRQMASASLRAYLDGRDTLQARQQIVVDYLNTMPLAAPPGAGEVFGLGDGLWGWYGADFSEVNRLLLQTAHNPVELEATAMAYRKVLSLLIAQRRPSALLGSNPRKLATLTESHLRLLHTAGVIDAQMLRAALMRDVVPSRRPMDAADPLSERKAADAIRTQVAALLRMDRTYDLERLDLAVETPLDSGLQRDVARQLKALAEPAQARRAGLFGPKLLARGDLSKVVYSFILFERTDEGNLLRAQADSNDQAFDVNDGSKLDLGSTAKLRTLVTYLELVAELHERFGRLDREALPWVKFSQHDELSRWALEYLSHTSERSLEAMLDAALDRFYSASPSESFFTGGGVHHFENYHATDNARTVSVRRAFSESINLPFIRLMRDIVQHLMFGLDGSGWVEAAQLSRRDEYLSRFAAREGAVFLRRFYRKYHGLNPDAMLARLANSIKGGPSRQSAAFLTVAPDANIEALHEYLARRLPPGTNFNANKLYARFAPERYSLSDRGALARVHPLELWLVEYLRRNPDATIAELLRASVAARQDAYRWLLQGKRNGAQDLRIRTIREEDAFAIVGHRWRRLGYPFDTLVPSYATAIGSSADRPAALAELMGIIANDGMRLPVIKINALHFAQGTPFETRLVRLSSSAQRVLAPEIAAALKKVLRSVVEQGTARRLSAPLELADGSTARFAGKTGTGDNRIKTVGADGRVVSSRAASRSGTFVFMLGERYFGTITAHVSGEAAEHYEFTSALPLQVMTALAPALSRHLGEACVPVLGGKVFARNGTPNPGTQNITAVADTRKVSTP
ncbi:MAG: glycosyl transferase family 51 [Proteobacteria bacterium]|nr:MAG: glycosyl transferase family 51 [Pseudomonadota bacterium]